MVQLNQIKNEIWIYEGSKVDFYGFPFTTRMTVVRLCNGDLWIHSPEKINNGLKKELSSIGKVKYLICPNKLHHLFLQEWIDAYPDAKKYSSPGLSKKRKDIKFDVELTDNVEEEWKGDLEQTIFHGSPAMEEVVFFHKQSATLIITDLIENFEPSKLIWWQKLLARFAGILHPCGKMPIDWRFSFLFGSKERARQSLNTMLEWQPDNIILSHGKCIFGGGTEFMKNSFAWLNINS